MYKANLNNNNSIGVVSNALNVLKNNYSTQVCTLYSKDKSLDLKSVNQYYATSQYPGHLIPTFYQSKFELEQSYTTTTAEQESLKIIYSPNNEQIIGSEGSTQFNINKYFNELTTILFGRQIIHSKLISSTQTLSMKFLSNTRQGIAFITDQQSSGKGRGGNSWVSPIGCLSYSFKCKQTDGNKLPFLQYVAGLAMIEAVHSFPIAKDLDIRLKWPNDIYDATTNLKIGGILCQSNYLNQEFDVVVGIGINVTNSNNPSISINQMIHKNQQPTTKEEEEPTPVYISRESLLSKFFNVFEDIYITFTRDGFKPFESRYTDNWLHTNQVVQLKDNDNKYVKIIGLETNGFLKSIECDSNGNQTSNQTFELHPDGTSFDLNNLILKKKE